jgi:DMSO/TMAO reductase YedYZ molybdopterin-dependent catalytic subunit
MPEPRTFLTRPEKFTDVSRGDPKPFKLEGEALVKARLTPETWRLEIVGEGDAKVEKPRKIEDNTALDFEALLALGKKHGVKFLKAMQCSNIAQPLGQGLWEGVPLREVLRLVGKYDGVRRVYYWGFHNNDPKQMFRSSMALNQALDCAPGELLPFLAYRLNGEPISLLRGGPVRLVMPWAHGFKSIKWLQNIVLTSDWKNNDTYAEQNNDPESYLKTAAYLDNDRAETFPADRPVVIRGTAMVGWPGLKRVEYWLRPDAGTHGKLADDDPAWQTAKWLPCAIEPPPTDWGGGLPDGVLPKDVWGFDERGKPREWPLRYSIALWSVTLESLKPGGYEFRVRTVDQNGVAQPEPRPYPRSGRNAIPVKQILVMM